VTTLPPALPARGVVRLLNTAGGRVLCLAGEVDGSSVEAFVRRYGREPMPVDGIDAGSVTRLSTAGLDLVLDHLDAAERAGRQVRVRRTPTVERLLRADGQLGRDARTA
jgi:anti-anti-sigma regulatory factor